jgi:methanogenic corrinoid protein MtbC1
MDLQRGVRPDPDASEDRMAARGAVAAPSPRLADLIASAVIPRLLLSCRANAVERRPSATHVETLARLALARDPSAAGAQVEALVAGGLSIESVLNDLIAPAARRLGDYWHADSADFVEVALASQRLAGIVRGLGLRIERERPAPAQAPKALIGSPASERHALGALIVAQTFRAVGWRVREAPGASPAELARLVARERFDLAGLSAAWDRTVDELSAAVSGLRAASANRRLLIAVGGPALRDDPATVAATGADFIAEDAREAASRAETLLSRHG